MVVEIPTRLYSLISLTTMTPRIQTTIQLRTIITLVLTAIFVTSIAGYIYYRSKNLVDGPIIALESPLNGSSISDSLTEIKGSAKNVSAVYVNGKKVFIDEEGKIAEKLLLAEGYNIISVKAEDRFNRKVEKKLEVIYRP
jgi:hypothetical protein